MEVVAPFVEQLQGGLDEIHRGQRQLAGTLRIDDMIVEINKLEKRTDRQQIKLRAALFKEEDKLPPVHVMFYYKLIELIGEIADYAERTGNRLQILISV